MRVTVRKGTVDDAAPLAGFRWRAESADTGPRRDAFVALFTAWFRDHLSSHVPFIAEVGDDVVGMAWLMVAERVPSPASLHRRCGDVQSVHVAPERRGSGIGTALLAAVLAEAGKLGLEHVTVHSGERAVTLYRRAGFDHNHRWLVWKPA
jgi:GNAT superfamily N-acetyltransferase